MTTSPDLNIHSKTVANRYIPPRPKRSFQVMTWPVARLVAIATLACTLSVFSSVASAETCHRLDPEPPTSPERISEFGTYQGYSEARYDSFVRSSVYIGVSDGGRLATDVMIPANDCVQAGDPLPVLWT
ncbi:MAG: hypothetical protein AAGG56_14265 [Pseudomonadota bacterium]